MLVKYGDALAGEGAAGVGEGAEPERHGDLERAAGDERDDGREADGFAGIGSGDETAAGQCAGVHDRGPELQSRLSRSQHVVGRVINRHQNILGRPGASSPRIGDRELHQRWVTLRLSED